MNDGMTRELMVQAVIVVALAIGGWMVFVQPRAKELHALEQEVVRLQSLRPASMSLSLQQLTEPAARLQDRAKEIQEQSALAGDSSHWYEVISGLAEDRDLLVLGIRPAALLPIRDAEGANYGRIDVLVDGKYDTVAEFIDDLLEMEGFLRLDSVQLTPARREGSKIVHAQIAIDAMSFKLPESLLTLEEVLGAER